MNGTASSLEDRHEDRLVSCPFNRNLPGFWVLCHMSGAKARREISILFKRVLLEKYGKAYVSTFSQKAPVRKTEGFLLCIIFKKQRD